MRVVYRGPSDVYRIGETAFPRNEPVEATDEQVARIGVITDHGKHKFDAELSVDPVGALAEAHTRAQLMEKAKAAGIDVSAGATKAEIAGSLVAAVDADETEVGDDASS